MAMNKDTCAAKEILEKNGYTCVISADGEEYHSTLRGVRPLIDLLGLGKDLSAFSAADKTVGLGAAHLYVLLGVRSVWARVMSSSAKSLLEEHGIDAFCDELVPYIINREGNGRCPVESAVDGIADSREAYKVICETLLALQKK